jgi:hypothetical protein
MMITNIINFHINEIGILELAILIAAIAFAFFVFEIIRIFRKKRLIK